MKSLLISTLLISSFGSVSLHASEIPTTFSDVHKQFYEKLNTNTLNFDVRDDISESYTMHLNEIVNDNSKFNMKSEFKNYNVYYNIDQIDLDRINLIQMSNAVKNNRPESEFFNSEFLMKSGKAPIGSDGKYLKLCQLMDTPNSSLYEITNSSLNILKKELPTRYKQRMDCNLDIEGSYWKNRAKISGMIF